MIGGNMVLVGVLVLGMISSAAGMFPDDPWLTKVKGEMEYFQEDGDDVFEWDIDTWRGQDLRKFWFKTAGEYADSEVENANIELVYSRAVTAFWDQQFGVRQDFDADPETNARRWLSFGYIGTAPYFVDVDARIFVGEQSSTQLFIELERELMITQAWVLTPELDIVANGRTNERFSEGSGLAEIEFSLRLGYEHNGNRKFQPFIGVEAKTHFGATKRLIKSSGGSNSESFFTLGLHYWF